MAFTSQSKTFYGRKEKLIVVEEGRQISSGQHRIDLEVACGLGGGRWWPERANPASLMRPPRDGMATIG